MTLQHVHVFHAHVNILIFVHNTNKRKSGWGNINQALIKGVLRTDKNNDACTCSMNFESLRTCTGHGVPDLQANDPMMQTSLQNLCKRQ